MMGEFLRIVFQISRRRDELEQKRCFDSEVMQQLLTECNHMT